MAMIARLWPRRTTKRLKPRLEHRTCTTGGVGELAEEPSDIQVSRAETVGLAYGRFTLLPTHLHASSGAGGEATKGKAELPDIRRRPAFAHRLPGAWRFNRCWAHCASFNSRRSIGSTKLQDRGMFRLPRTVPPQRWITQIAAAGPGRQATILSTTAM